MSNPHAIVIHCDGAMDYDRTQTGGNGFHIEFPESIDHVEVSHSIRNDGQGIHRLEIISVIEAMKELLSLEKKGEVRLRNTSGVEIYTDRLSVVEMQDPYKLQAYRSNGWKTHEQKPVKDRELWDELDKTRKKLASQAGGRVEINYKREKQNKIADKLSKQGKKSIQSRRVKKKIKNVAPRIFDGPDIDHSLLSPGDALNVHVYAWEPVQKEIEISTEVLDGEHAGKVVTLYVDYDQKSQLQRRHKYEIVISEVHTHHIKISASEEISG
jgi:ribonuclease HI